MSTFFTDNWGNFLNMEPISVLYWVALVIMVLTFVQPSQLSVLVEATGVSIGDMQMYSTVVVAGLYAKVQLRLF